MKTEFEISFYAENLDRKERELENDVIRHYQLHQIYPDAGHEQSRILAERQLLAVRAKAAALEWILAPGSGHIPKD